METRALKAFGFAAGVCGFLLAGCGPSSSSAYSETSSESVAYVPSSDKHHYSADQKYVIH